MSKNKKNNSNAIWILKITLMAFMISFAFSYASESLLPKVNVIVGIIILLVFILIGILFDMVGVAMTSCDISPLNAMNARKIKGANVAVKFVKSADKVASFCNDVVGDICGIISGSAGAIVSASLSNSLNISILFISLLVASITAALTIGGKAIGKGVAIKNNTAIVFCFSKVISLVYNPKK